MLIGYLYPISLFISLSQLTLSKADFKSINTACGFPFLEFFFDLYNQRMCIASNDSFSIYVSVPNPLRNPCCVSEIFLISYPLKFSILCLIIISNNLKNNDVALIGLNSSIVFPSCFISFLQIKKFLAVACCFGISLSDSQ